MKERGKIGPFKSMKVANVTLLHAVLRRVCEPPQGSSKTWCVLEERGDYEANPSNYRITLGAINQNDGVR
jgi:hypothetical protein